MSIPTSLNPMGVATNPEPLYYNIQVSVDKDYIYDQSYNTYNIYKDSPEIFYHTTNTNYPHSWYGRLSSSPQKFGIVYHDVYEDTKFYIDDGVVFNICEEQYPLPNIITIEYNGINFTFTPIPVYE